MPILIVWAFLILFGIFAIFSVSIFESFQHTLNSLSYNEPSNYHFFIKQIEHLWVGIFLWILLYFLPLDFIKKHKWKLFLASLAFLLLVFTSLWVALKWANLWINVKWFWTIQPWEFVKLWFVIFFSGWLVKKQKVLHGLEWFIAMIVVCGVSLFLFLLLPDFGTLLIMAPVALIMYAYAWWNIKYILASLILWIIFTFTIWVKFDYIKNRIEFFLHPEIDKTTQWIWYQTRQWLISVWWWGILWKWYGKWLQKFWFIPEAQSDFIFAAFAEEIWLLWNSILLTLYFLLVRFWIKRLYLVKDPYEQFVVVWLLSLIFWQAFVNIWVNIKLIPLTWLTLPFVSYGGSALIVNIFELILLYKILYKK